MFCGHRRRDLFQCGNSGEGQHLADPGGKLWQRSIQPENRIITKADQNRLIASLKQLNAQEDLESVVDMDEVLRYFVVHNFVCNFDSYTGSMGMGRGGMEMDGFSNGGKDRGNTQSPKNRE